MGVVILWRGVLGVGGWRTRAERAVGVFAAGGGGWGWLWGGCGGSVW